MKKCLKKQYAPPGVELEWQRKFHTTQQKQGESLTEFSARLLKLLQKQSNALDDAVTLACRLESAEGLSNGKDSHRCHRGWHFV